MGSQYRNVNLFAPAMDSTDTCGKKISLAPLQRSRAEINGNCEGCLPLYAMHALKLWPPAILKHNLAVLSSFRPLISNVKREKKLVAGLEERLKYSGQHMLQVTLYKEYYWTDHWMGLFLLEALLLVKKKPWWNVFITHQITAYDTLWAQWQALKIFFSSCLLHLRSFCTHQGYEKRGDEK